MRNSLSSLLVPAFLLLATTVQADNAPTILSRTEWGAKPASLPMKPQEPKAILVHHTGSAMKPTTTLIVKMQGLQRFSQAKEKLSDGRMKPAWPDVPYHFYISENGQIAEGRSITAIGDTNTGYDPTGFIQVVVEGNFETETLTAAEEKSLSLLLGWLTQKYNIKREMISGHKSKAQTACPGKDLEAKLPAIIANLK